MRTYQTSEIAQLIGIHPNTVRFYEESALISTPKRQKNGYRVFTELHVEQFQLARKAFQVEVLLNGLRKKAIDIIKISAVGDFDQAILLTMEYIRQIDLEYSNAEEAIVIAQQIIDCEVEKEVTDSHLSTGRNEISGDQLIVTRNEITDHHLLLTRKETAAYLEITMDTLRNWEMNGLITIKRKQNGYRVYTEADLKRLKIIRSLRCANYSLAAILRMMKALSSQPNVDIRAVIDTPRYDEDIISVCDRVLTSLVSARDNAQDMLVRLTRMKKQFHSNPLL